MNVTVATAARALEAAMRVMSPKVQWLQQYVAAKEHRLIGCLFRAGHIGIKPPPSGRQAFLGLGREDAAGKTHRFSRMLARSEPGALH
jgi:hypothetical protein